MIVAVADVVKAGLGLEAVAAVEDFVAHAGGGLAVGPVQI
jgi:hypothetical protein